MNLAKSLARHFGSGAALVVLSAALAVGQQTGQAHDHAAGDKQQTTSGTSTGSQHMHQHMTAGMTEMQKMKLTGDADVDFATMMRMHHRHGIKMAEAELASGKDEKMKELARKILDAQKEEVAQLESWLEAKGHKHASSK